MRYKERDVFGEVPVSPWRNLLLVLSVVAGATSGLAQTHPMAPPLGWNSWDSYGLTITEAQFKDNVQWFHEHLQRYGWQYVVVDEGWYLASPENAGKPGSEAGYRARSPQGYQVDAYGRYVPATVRFPTADAGAGLKPLADYVHSLGLKFGIHIIRGIPREAVDKNLPIAGSKFHAAEAADTADTCRWNPDNYGVKANAAGQAYYDSLGRLYAGWGLDFVKIDCIASPYRDAEIRMVRRALDGSGRHIVLSLSPGPTPVDKADDVRRFAEMWRISDDFWDVWKKKPGAGAFPQSLFDQFTLLAKWAPHVVAGHWPDADMLPLGHLGPRPGWGEERDTRLTADEQRTLLTLWSMARSPLVIGANLTRMDAATEELLTNPEVLAVDQHSSGNSEVLREGDTVAWLAKSGRAAEDYLAVFNTGDEAKQVSLAWKQVRLAGTTFVVRDLWRRADLGEKTSLEVTLPPHACVLYRLRPAQSAHIAKRP